MKRIAIVISMLMMVAGLYGQRLSTTPIIGADTFELPVMTNPGLITVKGDLVAGDTISGTLKLYGSSNGVDYFRLGAETGRFKFYSADTLAMSDGGGWLIEIIDSQIPYYKVGGMTDSSNDTISISQWYNIKR